MIASTPADLLPIVYLCTNRVAPAHEGLELGIGDATLIKASPRRPALYWSCIWLETQYSTMQGAGAGTGTCHVAGSYWVGSW